MHYLNKPKIMSAQLNKDYKIDALISNERFRTVFRCSFQTSGEAFAMKYIDKNFFNNPLNFFLFAKKSNLAAKKNRGVHKSRRNKWEQGPYIHKYQDYPHTITIYTSKNISLNFDLTSHEAKIPRQQPLNFTVQIHSNYEDDALIHLVLDLCTVCS